MAAKLEIKTPQMCYYPVLQVLIILDICSVGLIFDNHLLVQSKTAVSVLIYLLQIIKPFSWCGVEQVFHFCGRYPPVSSRCSDYVQSVCVS